MWRFQEVRAREARPRATGSSPVALPASDSLPSSSSKPFSKSDAVLASAASLASECVEAAFWRPAETRGVGRATFDAGLAANLSTISNFFRADLRAASAALAFEREALAFLGVGMPAGTEGRAEQLAQYKIGAEQLAQ